VERPIVLEVDDLTVSTRSKHSPQTLVRGVSFDLRDGECLGLVGESGSGKSLTLRSVIGLLPRTLTVAGGSIRLAPRDGTVCRPFDARAARGTDIGMIFQEPMRALNPLMRVETVVGEPLRQHLGLRRRAGLRRAAELLGEVGIADPERVLQCYPHQLSGGLRQRVMIAAALACEPRVLLCDEPTTALDVTIQAQIIRLLTELATRRGLSIVFVSHDLGVISTIADRIAVMYAGQVVEVGPTAAVLARPAHAYTDRLIRSVPSVHDGGVALEAIPGVPPLPTELPAVGCAFAPRCHLARGDCDDARVPLHLVGEAHQSRCLRAADLVLGKAS